MPTKSNRSSRKKKAVASTISLLVDLKAASEILGLAPSSVRNLIATGDLRAIRAGRGGKFFISRTALSEFAAGLPGEVNSSRQPWHSTENA